MPERRSALRRPGVTAGAAALLVAAAATTSAGGTPVDQASAGTLRLTPTRVPAGATLLVTGRRWPALKRVRVLVGPPNSEADPVATVRAKRNGRLRKRIPLSAAAVPGDYVMLACRRQCAVKRSARFTITPAE